MQEAIQAIKDELDKTTGEGRNEELARQLSDAYVAANPAVFAQMETMEYQTLVASVDTMREAGLEENQWQIEIWLLHRYDKQHIGGAFQPVIRNPTPVEGE